MLCFPIFNILQKIENSDELKTLSKVLEETKSICSEDLDDIEESFFNKNSIPRRPSLCTHMTSFSPILEHITTSNDEEDNQHLSLLEEKHDNNENRNNQESDQNDADDPNSINIRNSPIPGSAEDISVNSKYF